MKIVWILFLTLIFSSCNSKTEKLFRIDKNTNHKSDFIYMVESMNIPPIPADSVRKYLNWDEIKSTRLLESHIYSNDTILSNPVIFKDYGKIYTNDKFKAHVFLRIGNYNLDRDYKFFIRTYSADWKIIDNFDLAIWNENDRQFCFGSINSKLIIERYCDGSELIDILQITEDGKIIITSYHKP